MKFKSEKQLEAFLMKKCRLALLKAQDEVYRIIKRFVYDYYKDYSPDFYERTRQLLESLVESRITSYGKGYKAEVYFNIGGLNYTTGAQPTGEQVMAAATQGLHGAIGSIPNSDKEYKYVSGKTGVNIWSDPIKELDAEAINILKQMLISEGVPIK
jgi:hypothetical protein